MLGHPYCRLARLELGNVVQIQQATRLLVGFVKLLERLRAFRGARGLLLLAFSSVLAISTSVVAARAEAERIADCLPAVGARRGELGSALAMVATETHPLGVVRLLCVFTLGH